MPATVRDLPKLVTTSTSALTVGPIGKLDDASSITIFLASTITTLTSGTVVQISQFDPFDPVLPTGVIESTRFYSVSSSNLYTSGAAIVLTNISFRGLQLAILASASVAGETYAFVSKQISV